MDSRKLKDKATEAFGKGKFAKAAEAYAQYCEADPSDVHARLRMGDAWSKAGQKEKAIGAYSWAAEGFAKEGFLPRAIAASKLILELDPAHKEVQKMLADLYARKNQPGKKTPTLPPSAAATAAARGMALAPEAAKPAPRAPPRNEPPSPMNRPDAIELPPDDLPPETGSAVDAKQRQAFAVRDDAIALPESSPPLARAPSPKQVAIELDVATGADDSGGDALDVGTVGGSGSAEIEVAVIDSRPSAPPLQGIPLDGPLDLAPPPPAPRPVAPPPGPRGGVYEIDVGDDESLDHYAASLEVEAPRPVAPPAPLPEPEPSAPAYALEVELEPESPRPPLRMVPAPPAPSSFPAEALDAPAPQVELTSPSFAVPSIAPMAALPPEAVVPEVPRPSPSLPPGLRPRRQTEVSLEESLAPTAAAPPAAAPPAAAPDARIWLPPGFAPPAVAPLARATDAPRAAALVPEAKSASTDLEKSLEAFARFDVDAVPPPPPPAAMPSFTELEMDGDSLLHAVEAAAHQGSAARGEAVAEELVDVPDADAMAPGALPKIPLFSDLPEDAFIALFERCPLRRHEPGELVVGQGSQGAAFYVICAGSVRVFRTDQGRRRDLATLEEGAFFGEMALLSDAPRSASVEAASPDTQLLEISAAVLADLSKEHPHVATALKKFCRQRMLSNLMASAQLFQPFSTSDRRDLVQKFRTRETKKGDVVIREGHRSDGMYVILSGEVDVSVGAAPVASLKEGDVFGEMSLLTKAPATATVTASRRTSLLRLPREDFDALILSHPQILMLVSELTDERKRQNATLVSPSNSAPMV